MNRWGLDPFFSNFAKIEIIYFRFNREFIIDQILRLFLIFFVVSGCILLFILTFY